MNDNERKRRDFKGTIFNGYVPQTSNGYSLEKYGNNSVPSPDGKLRSDEKRLQSLKERSATYAERQKIVSASLRQIDAKDKHGSVNKKITFASSSSDEDEEFDNEESSVAPKFKVSSGTNRSDRIEVPNKEKRPLFDDDDESDNENVDDLISSKKFDGDAGAKLLELQAKYGGGVDPRFYMDERFLQDDDEGGENLQEDSRQISSAAAEHESNSRILEKVLGKPLHSEKKPAKKTGNIIVSAYARYDPENPSHQRYQLKNSDEKIEEKELMSDIEEEEEEEEEEEIFSDQNIDSEEDQYEHNELEESGQKKLSGLDPEFASRLKKKSSRKMENLNLEEGDVEDDEERIDNYDKPFSLRALFGRENEEESEEKNEKMEAKNRTAAPLNFSSWQLALMQVDDSSDESDAEPRLQKNLTSEKVHQLGQKEPKNTPESSAVKRETFFFYDDQDERILKEAKKFRRMCSMAVVRKTWEKQRASLAELYKSRKKQSVKNNNRKFGLAPNKRIDNKSKRRKFQK